MTIPLIPNVNATGIENIEPTIKEKINATKSNNNPLLIPCLMVKMMKGRDKNKAATAPNKGIFRETKNKTIKIVQTYPRNFLISSTNAMILACATILRYCFATS